MRNHDVRSNFAPMPKKMPMSAADAAAQLGVHKRTVQAAIARGDLKAHKLGGLTGSYIIDQRDLDKWSAKREAKTPDRAEASA